MQVGILVGTEVGIVAGFTGCNHCNLGCHAHGDIGSCLFGIDTAKVSLQGHWLVWKWEPTGWPVITSRETLPHFEICKSQPVLGLQQTAGHLAGPKSTEELSMFSHGSAVVLLQHAQLHV